MFGSDLPGAQKWLITLSVMLVTIMQILVVPLMRRVRPQPAAASGEASGRVEPLPTAVE